MSAKPELMALTSVRGIAAWMVVLYHLSDNLGGPRLILHGYLAVDFFFVLSGFVIWLTYSDRLRGGGLSAYGSFMKHRIARIWPLHVFILACWVVFVLVTRQPGFDFRQLPLQIILAHNWGFTSTLGWNIPAWSISAEMLAYISFPLLALFVNWERMPTAVILAGIAALSAALYALCVYRGWDTLLPSVPKLGVARCLVGFSIGTAVCALWLRWREAWLRPAIISAALSVALLAAWTAGVLPEPLVIPPAFAAAILSLALTAGKHGNLVEVAPLHYLGQISFATYLSHALIERLFVMAVPGVQPWPVILTYLATVMLCSVALYHLVERPAQRWVKAIRWAPLSRRASALT